MLIKSCSCSVTALFKVLFRHSKFRLKIEILQTVKHLYFIYTAVFYKTPFAKYRDLFRFTESVRPEFAPTVIPFTLCINLVESDSTFEQP